MTTLLEPSRLETCLQVERVACTHCGSPAAQRLFTERYELAGEAVNLGINRCCNCELVYVSPRLTPESTRLMYELDAAATISHNYCWEGSASESRFRGLLNRLAKLRDGGRLLDVGCGGGHFLRAAQSRGNWDVIGLEPIESAAVQAEQYAGCDVRCATLEDADFEPASFDVISLLGVLEHIHEPVAVLRTARTLLRTNGLLAIYVPNYHYLRLKDTGPLCYARTRRWSRLHPQEHLHQFTPRTLALVLRTAGFEVVQVDVGRPFASPHRTQQLVKQAAYAATCGLRSMTGIHLGGLEVIARPSHNDVLSRPPGSDHRMRL